MPEISQWEQFIVECLRNLEEVESCLRLNEAVATTTIGKDSFS